ncbi:MAG: TRAP transporter substrate-binding protein DctP [Elusimicrobiota bacterium]|jgi:TRAP-type C4-dicarboxylate transport system substrate-binding protein|nr:TRAP transporter substrate-binding protein DctP [Elusimicrobiota bacterium]
MKKIISAVLTAVFAFALVLSAIAAPKKIQVRFAGTEADTTPQSQALHEVAKRLNASGLFDVKVFTAGSLSNDTDGLVTQALQGAPIVVPSDPGRIATNQKVLDYGILMAPYVLKDYRVLDKLIQTPLYKEWEAAFEKNGLKLVTNNWYNGMRHFITNKQVTKVADLKGLRIRGFGNTIGVTLAKALGYANMSLPMTEIFSAVQTKAIDGAEMQIPASYGARFYEVLKYQAMTSHYMLTSSIVTGAKFFNSMPKEAQDLFIKTFRDVGTEWQPKVAATEQANLDAMKKAGLIVSTVDTSKFEAAVQPYYKEMGFSDAIKNRLLKELSAK